MLTPAEVADSSEDRSNFWRLRSVVLFSAVVVAASLFFLVWPTLGRGLFATGYLPHRYCFLGNPALVWTHVVSDVVIAASYFAISITLVFLVIKGRWEVPFHWMFLAFGLFIVACGSAHLVEAITVWNPIYWFLGALKMFTAVASIGTAILLPFIVPQVLTVLRKARVSERVTEQLRASEKRREALLHEVQERQATFEQFFSSAPDAILVVDEQGRITDFNEQAQRFFGYTREEIVGHNIELLVPEHARGKHLQQRRDYVQAPKVRLTGKDMDLHARKKDGTVAPVDVSLSPLRFGGGLHVMAAVRDMTDHKIAEQKLRDSLNEKEVLLREVHHRVKNNLAVICSLFYLESSYAKDEHTAQVFRESESRVHSMALVHESLYGSHNLARIDFAEYAKTLAIDILSTYGNQRNGGSQIELKTDLQPVVMGIDLAVSCGLILNELVSNAIKHGLNGQRRGELRLSLQKYSDGNCLLAVEDNGPGIALDFDATSNRSLGLRLVRSLTKQIRGSFVISRAEPGTSAKMEFPLKPATD